MGVCRTMARMGFREVVDKIREFGEFRSGGIGGLPPGASDYAITEHMSYVEDHASSRQIAAQRMVELADELDALSADAPERAALDAIEGDGMVVGFLLKNRPADLASTSSWVTAFVETRQR